jgi:amino-acid N-acetyltransferase
VERLLRQATASDLEGVLALLQSVSLPSEGVREYLNTFVVVEDDGLIIGCAGYEQYDDLALLRWVAVHPQAQNSKLGSTLVTHVVKYAAARGVKEVILLTTTAKDFFTRRHGFEVAAREDFESRLAASPEWNLPRCSSAVVLRKTLKN